MSAIEGDVAPGFEQVRDVFGNNFENNGDVGAALCVYRHGRKVVDLWGGLADAATGRPWARDTLQLVYSSLPSAASIAFTSTAQSCASLAVSGRRSKPMFIDCR